MQNGHVHARHAQTQVADASPGIGKPVGAGRVMSVYACRVHGCQPDCGAKQWSDRASTARPPTCWSCAAQPRALQGCGTKPPGTPWDIDSCVAADTLLSCDDSTRPQPKLVCAAPRACKCCVMGVVRGLAALCCPDMLPGTPDRQLDLPSVSMAGLWLGHQGEPCTRTGASVCHQGLVFVTKDCESMCRNPIWPAEAYQR